MYVSMMMGEIDVLGWDNLQLRLCATHGENRMVNLNEIHKVEAMHPAEAQKTRDSLRRSTVEADIFHCMFLFGSWKYHRHSMEQLDV